MKKYAPITLLKFDDAMKNIGINYWIDFGTLLGAIRDQKIIDFDHDIDVSIFLDDYTIEIEKELERAGFQKKYKYEIKNNKGLELTYLYKGVLLDIFFYIKSDNQMYYHYFLPEEGETYLHTIQKFGSLLGARKYLPNSGFKKILFLEREFNVPFDYSSHLQSIYGSSCLIHDPKWTPDRGNYVFSENERAKVTIY